MRYLNLAFTVLTAVAQPPAQDARNTVIPNTDTYFTMPVYKTRAEWEVRARHLRKQILSAAGRPDEDAAGASGKGPARESATFEDPDWQAKRGRRARAVCWPVRESGWPRC